MDDIVERLRAACVGHPNARIPWPHRMLHEAADTIDRQREEIGRLCERMTQAAHDVLAERERHKTVEGWDETHDNEHSRSEIAHAAACYAVGRIIQEKQDRDRFSARFSSLWPWDLRWWKPSGTRRNLVKSGALILAEIERLDRRTALSDTTSERSEDAPTPTGDS